jgi:hypothetical protein
VSHSTTTFAAKVITPSMADGRMRMVL